MFQSRHTIRISLLVLLFITAVVGCQKDAVDSQPTLESESVQLSASMIRPADSIASEPLAAAAAQADTLFTQLTSAESGIDFQNLLSQENQRNFTFNGAGVASGDYDRDGFVDLFLVTEEGQSKLYRNLGDMGFEDVTEPAGLGDNSNPEGFSIGATFADIDNDHDLDLFLTNWDVPDLLYRNNGNGTFTDITDQAGVGYPGGSTTATFADYDRDGDLDFFVATYRPHDFANEFGSPQLETIDGQIVIPEDYQSRIELVETEDGLSVRQLGEPDLLYRNNGDGTFTEVGEAAGIIGGYWGLSASFSEIDNDGWPDLYVTNDFWSPDTFYHNNGDGTFSLIDPDLVQHTPTFAMGMDFGDINNDGLTDYFVGDMLSRDATLRLTQHGLMDTTLPPDEAAAQIMRNGLFLNNGDGSFSDIAWMADVAASEWTWTTKFADLDLDGYVDLLITNGMIGDLMDSDVLATINAPQFQNAPAYFPDYPQLATRNLIFRNNGDLTFDETAVAWGFDNAVIGHGATLADLDNDGDLDAVVNNMNQPVGVYRNDALNNRLVVQLNGRLSNSQGIGAQVVLTGTNGIQSRIMSTSGGYLSSHEPVLVFGLGEAETIEALQVTWPSGHIQRFTDEDGQPLAANRLYTIVEPDSPSTPPPARWLTAQNAQFEEVSLAAGLTNPHSESDFDDNHYEGFDDFDGQPLLPRRLSTLGPGVAWSDIDLDGDDDLYIAGALDQTGSLYQNLGDGSFAVLSDPAPAAYEEVAPLWLHNGRFATPSLFLTISSYENSAAPFVTQFVPEGSDPFQLSDAGWQENSLASGGALAANDVDGDGDLDLFVGGRAVPDQWPLPAPSRLYLNQDGVFSDATEEIAPDLGSLGLATGALWLDVDSDGDSDLLVATEFGPVRLFVNENGRLSDATAQAGLDQWTGLWTGITAGDFNEDGHMDFAAANLGLNTKYTASPEHPTVVYAGNIDGDGDVDIVEAEYVDGVLRPVRERGMTGAEMPFILEEFDTFRAYAEASLEEIFGDRLNEAELYTANTLAHTLFINDGNGRFTAMPLPQLAQITTGYGLTTADFDNDGHDDLYLVGNFSYADHETRQYTGGISYWLRGLGDGTFTVVPSSESGLFVPYDGRGTAVSDYDNDGWVDVVVGVNDSHPLLFRNKGNADNCAVRVSLTGDLANPTGVGARIIVTLPDGSTTTREVQAGSSYFSQDSATHLFGLGQGDSVDIQVMWPDGTISEASAQPCGDVAIAR